MKRFAACATFLLVVRSIEPSFISSKNFYLQSQIVERTRCYENQNHFGQSLSSSKSNIVSRLIFPKKGIKQNTSITVDGKEKENVGLMLPLSRNGIYQLTTQEEHAALLKAHPDKLIVVKFYADYCRACKALEPLYLRVKNDKQLENLPIVWAEFCARQNNKQFFKSVGILSLPTVHFYDGSNNGGLVENFPCGPNNIPLLKKKLATFLNERVNPNTLTLKKVSTSKEDMPREEQYVSIDNEIMTAEVHNFLRSELPFFTDLSDDEFVEMLQKAKLQSFSPGDVIMRQGEPAHKFFVIESGKGEMLIKSRFEDPISTPPSYLGAVVHSVGKFDYFGERALTTGEPYAASVRALSSTRCFIFNVEDIPESSILSKQRKASKEFVDRLSQRYELPKDYVPTRRPSTSNDNSILELLVRFKQIRQAAKCFNYVMENAPNWGNSGEIARRSVLANKLSKSQREEFQEVFSIADANHDGKLTLLELQKFMESARTRKSSDEIVDIISKANIKADRQYNEYGISLDEFMGVMAEAEFYSLFLETFQVLDIENSGYVRAGDLDDVLHGVRDLISDDHKSIIDVEDKDVQIDYEQFSKMLLGAAL